METKAQVGTLIVTEHDVRTTYPIYLAQYDIVRYTDLIEVSFLVSASAAVSNPHEDKREPRLKATFFGNDLDPADLSSVEFEITAPAERPKWPPVDAQFYYFAIPGMPEDLRSGRIQFRQAVVDGYEVHWTATLDSYNSRPTPQFADRN